MEDIEKKIIWLAGLTDGEGTITVFHNHENVIWDKDGYERLHCIYSLANTNPIIINESQKILFDIGVTSQIFQRKPLKENHSIGMHLNVRKLSHIKIVIERIMPYLVGKKAQAELVLRFCNSRLNREVFHLKKKNHSKPFSDEEFEISKKLYELNKKGQFKASETKRQTPKGEDIVRTALKDAELITV